MKGKLLVLILPILPVIFGVLTDLCRISGQLWKVALWLRATCSSFSAVCWSANRRTGVNTLPYPWSPQSSICRILRILLVFYTWTSSWKCMEGQKSIHVLRVLFSAPVRRDAVGRWIIPPFPLVGWLGAPEELSGGLIPWTRCVPIFGPALKRGEAPREKRQLGQAPAKMNEMECWPWKGTPL